MLISLCSISCGNGERSPHGYSFVSIERIFVADFLEGPIASPTL